MGSSTYTGRRVARYPETVEFTPAPGARLKLAGFGLVLVAICAALIYLPTAKLAVPLLGWIGWIGLAVFLPATAYAVTRAVRPPVALQLTADGLRDNSSVSAVGFVPWPEITGVGTAQISGSWLVGVHLRDPEEFVARLGMFRRMSARANLQMFGVPVWINPAGLPDATELAGMIDVYRRTWELQAQR